MRILRLPILLPVIFLALASHAENILKGEAEAGAVIVSGNTESESYAAKSKIDYTVEKNIYSLFGRYLKTLSNGLESARNWEAGGRYERQITDYFGVFSGHKAESDVYNNYIQRDSTDLGLKYYVVKSDTNNWTLEAGYRYQTTQPVEGSISHDNMGRLFSSYDQAINDTLTFKYWAEYLPNITEHEAYLVNTEASLGIMLNSIFSLRLAYLLQYQNAIPVGGKYTTTTSTMNLVARFK